MQDPQAKDVAMQTSDTKNVAVQTSDTKNVAVQTSDTKNIAVKIDNTYIYKCGACRSGGRNLVVCIDGTANQFNKRNTNVVELYHWLRKDKNQLTFYNSGIGTYARESWKSWSYIKQVIGHKIDLAIAWRFKVILLDAYRWLSENYEPGDRIFLFGFSRGAYQVRVLSAMIETIGLIHKGNQAQIPFAYELYAHCSDPNDDQDGPSQSRLRKLAQDLNKLLSSVANSIGPKHTEEPTPDKMANKFKETFSRRDVKVHFIGAWDTVSSIGVNRSAKDLALTANGMKHVCFFRHALALDERRVKFLPEYAYGGVSLDPKKQITRLVSDSEKDGPSTSPHTKEVWFAGTHSDIGGGNEDNPELNNNGPALRWMLYEAGHAGLHTEQFKVEWSTVRKFENPIHESLTGVWWALEILPFKRLSYKGKSNATYRPHLGHPRHIADGQLIHRTVRTVEDQSKLNYHLKATSNSGPRPPEEPDDFDKILELSSKLDLKGEEQMDIVRELKSLLSQPTDSSTLRQSTHQIFLKLTAPNLQIVQEYSQIRELVSILADKGGGISPFDKKAFCDMPKEIQAMLKGSQEDQSLVTRFLNIFATAEILRISDAGGTVRAVAFSPDGTKIVSGSAGRTVRIWDGSTGKQLFPPLTGHTGRVRSVAVSLDGKIVSGSGWTLHMWDLTTGKALLQPLGGHDGWVTSVAFSPDGKQIASGSWDKTIRVWDAMTGEVLHVFKKHTAPVIAVAFSPDGLKIVSGSFDETIRVWNVKTGDAFLPPLTGHTNWVTSVAFSPDGTKIVSGSRDRTVRVWDATTGHPLLEPFKGHTDPVWSVAYSPDGFQIISGSGDKKIRVWDAATGQPLFEPFTGHTSWVYSVAYSPDGKRIVSGSADGTIRVWDATGKPGTSLLNAQNPNHQEDLLVPAQSFASEADNAAPGSSSSVQPGQAESV